MESDETRLGISPPKQPAREHYAGKRLTLKARHSVQRKNGTDACSTKDA
jgi:hypothetical protein